MSDLTDRLRQMMTEHGELCRCKAHMDDEPMSHHTKADHKQDCWTAMPCGGCWSCMAATVHYWEANDE
jgi:hypothetical protein